MPYAGIGPSCQDAGFYKRQFGTGTARSKETLYYTGRSQMRSTTGEVVPPSARPDRPRACPFPSLWSDGKSHGKVPFTLSTGQGK